MLVGQLHHEFFEREVPLGRIRELFTFVLSVAEPGRRSIIIPRLNSKACFRRFLGEGSNRVCSRKVGVLFEREIPGYGRNHSNDDDDDAATAMGLTSAASASTA